MAECGVVRGADVQEPSLINVKLCKYIIISQMLEPFVHV